VERQQLCDVLSLNFFAGPSMLTLEFEPFLVTREGQDFTRGRRGGIVRSDKWPEPEPSHLSRHPQKGRDLPLKRNTAHPRYQYLALGRYCNAEQQSHFRTCLNHNTHQSSRYSAVLKTIDSVTTGERVTAMRNRQISLFALPQSRTRMDFNIRVQ
jgi:hypothetical protein